MDKEHKSSPASSGGNFPLALPVFTGAVVLTALFVFFRSVRFPDTLAWLSYPVLFAALLVFLGALAWFVRALALRGQNLSRTSSALSILKYQSEILRSLLLAFGKIQGGLKNDSLRDKWKRIMAQYDRTSASLSEFETSASAGSSAVRKAGRLPDISRALQSDKDELVRLLDDFSAESARNAETVAATYTSMATLIYHLVVSMPILTDFTNIFKEFSKDMILEIISKFSDITNSSHRIADDIELSMSSLMDEQKEDSLAYIIRKAHDLVIDFESFYQNMDNLRNVSDTFTEKSAEKLRTIQEIANSIEQIAETIKVLSLNVSIEAANTGAGGRGFQVLARDLREFTTKTMRFAHDVKARVKDALSTTDSLKSNYQQSMVVVYKYMEDIKGSITSFESIIQGTFDKIKSIIENIRRFSQHIDTGIQEVVGKLQYYDITSQEVEHLRLFFEKLFIDIYNARSLPADISAVIPDADKSDIRITVLRTIGDIITTSSERKILRKYEEAFGMIGDGDGLSAERKEAEKNILLF